jgi:hypothetical protein
LKLLLRNTSDDLNKRLEIATAVKGYLEQLAVPRLFERVSILNGEAPTSAFKTMTTDSALVYILTDEKYADRPWCRQELGHRLINSHPNSY